METSIHSAVSRARLRLAWFRASAPNTGERLDDTAALVAELSVAHEITVFTATTAHEFVWRHFRAPFDLCVHELDHRAASQFIWPYLLHYGGVLLLRTLTVYDARGRALLREGRVEDYRAEVAFNGGRAGLRIPLAAAHVAVVPHAISAASLQEAYPEARVRCAPTGVGSDPGDVLTQGVESGHHRGLTPINRGLPPVTFGVVDSVHRDTLARAVQRACDAGARAALLPDGRPEDILEAADVVLALRWPPAGEPHVSAMVTMAAAKPLVVFETETTADWPALDPQTWQPRDRWSARPIVVSIDPLDEEHSLMLAIRRLADDEALRAELGAAAHQWWRTHATVRHAVEAWERILGEAASLMSATTTAEWPRHLRADGTERAREILLEVGVQVDFLA